MTRLPTVGRWVRTALAVAHGVLLLGTAHANECSTPAKDGSTSVSGTSVVNNYWPGTASANAGATTITLGAARNAGGPAIAAGDLLLIVEVQGASFNTTNSTAYGANNGSGRGYLGLTNAGNYEYVRATSALGTAGGSVSIAGSGSGGGLVSTYSNQAASASARVQRFEVIRVPQYRNLTISGTITSSPWNGTTGGIVAFDVAGTLTFSSGKIDVSGQGFRGGGGLTSNGASGYASTDYAAVNTGTAPHGAKGEGVSGTPYRLFDGTAYSTNANGEEYPGGSGARGAAGDAGGGASDGNTSNNAQNSGGGGGAGVGDGGQGGYTWCDNYASGTCQQTGGLGGVGIASGTTGLFFGGGGGAGSTNDNTGTLPNGASSSGAPGGGAILIRTGAVAGSGSLLANGSTFVSGLGNDGAGGGGGGGTIQFLARSSTATLTAAANGGNGISNTGASSSGTTQPHGPGGGGGGGGIVSNVALSSSVSGGAAGTTAANTSGFGNTYGAAPGAAGNVQQSFAASGVPGDSSGAECTPGVAKSFASSTTPARGPNHLTITLTNPNPTTAMTSVTTADTYPSGLANYATPNPSNTCGGTLTANAGASSLSLANASIPAAGSCTFTVDVAAGSAGSFTNTVAVGGVTAGTAGSTPPGTLKNIAPASATFTVTQGLAISKTETTFSDPVNNQSNPKAIPGAYIQYSLTVSNPSTTAVDADSVVLGDVIPSNTSLVVDPFYARMGYAGAQGPFQFVDGSSSSGLSFTFVNNSATNDSPGFSADGTTFTYTPSIDANSVDTAVKAVQFKMFGSMKPNSSFTINFLVRVN